jgi:hypothetical protein
MQPMRPAPHAFRLAPLPPCGAAAMRAHSLPWHPHARRQDDARLPPVLHHRRDGARVGRRHVVDEGRKLGAAHEVVVVGVRGCGGVGAWVMVGWVGCLTLHGCNSPPPDIRPIPPQTPAHLR